jgi:hypothetical protein
VKYTTKALKPLPEPNIQTTKESPWQCAACRSHRAGIHAVTGYPVCVRCEVSNTVVPGPALDLSRVWQRAIATSGDDELGVIAVLAGTRLVSPMARAERDLMTAYSLLDEHLTDAESWEVYAAIEFGRYEEALARMRELAGEEAVPDVHALLVAVECRLRARSLGDAS